MARQRSIVAGGTDYTGVPLADMLDHCNSWRAALGDDIEVLGNIRRRLVLLGDSAAVRDGLECIDHFVDLFGRYVSDIERLLSELPNGVFHRHVELVRQLYQSSVDAEQSCVAFKRRHHLDFLSPSDRVQSTLAEIYRCTRDGVVNLRDIGNLQSRLETFVEQSSQNAVQASTANALELKPNVFGIGLNLNYIWDRWGIAAFRRRRK